MGKERLDDPVDKTRDAIKDQSRKPTADRSQQVDPRVEKANSAPYRGFSAADDPDRTARVPVDRATSVDDA
ncbi:MAG: hypothetical protein ABR970_21710 [Roseiarcus sp.]